MTAKLKVLVIDDSAYNRQIISEILGSHPDMEVVGKAEDGEQGLKLAATLKPDLITLDVEMPRMDGFTFLRLLMSQLPTPVIVISSHSKKQEVFQALELGALDFIAKPARYLQPELQDLRTELIAKATAVRALQIVPFAKRSAKAQQTLPSEEAAAAARKAAVAKKVPLTRIVAIGSSTGGPPAIQAILKPLSPGTGTAYLIAQHMPEKFTRAFAERLNRLTGLEVHEAVDQEPMLPDHVYIAPGGGHLEVATGPEGPILSLKRYEKEDRYVPSIDKLFFSVARLRAYKVLAAVLTGMGSDGSLGIREVYNSGGRTVAESQESAIVFGMPKEAIQTGCIHDVLSLEAIIEKIHGFTLGR